MCSGLGIGHAGGRRSRVADDHPIGPTGAAQRSCAGADQFGKDTSPVFEETISMTSRKARFVRRVLPVLAVTALVLLIGRAALASNSVSASTGGYGTGTVSGATVQNVSFTFSADGATITGATLTLAGDLTGKVVSAGFNSNALTTCVTGAYASGTDTTPATCSGFAQATASAGTISVAVRQ
jgi:hypothetical protein